MKKIRPSEQKRKELAHFWHESESVAGNFLAGNYLHQFCGEGGIRTLDRLTPILVFETSAFNHSATSPSPWAA